MKLIVRFFTFCSGAFLLFSLVACSSDETKKPKIGVPGAQEGSAGDQEEEIEEIERSTALGSQTFVLPDVEEPETKKSQNNGKKKSQQRKGKSSERVKEGGWNCLGSIAASDAVKVIKKNKRAVRTCYEKRLRVDNTLQGKVSLKLRIDQKGNVDALQMSGSLRDREVNACIRKIATKWKFPKPKGGKCAVLSAPYTLTPRS